MSEINCYGNEENYGEVLPGWYLVRLVNKVDTPYFLYHDVDRTHFYTEMKEGSWGLTQENDPDIVFNIDPFSEIEEGASDLEWDIYINKLHHYESRLISNVEVGFNLVQAAIQAGFDLEEGGFAVWLADKLYHYLESIKYKPINIYPKA